MNSKKGPFGGHQNSVGVHVHQWILRWFPMKIHGQMSRVIKNWSIRCWFHHKDGELSSPRCLQGNVWASKKRLRTLLINMEAKTCRPCRSIVSWGPPFAFCLFTLICTGALIDVQTRVGQLGLTSATPAPWKSHESHACKLGTCCPFLPPRRSQEGLFKSSRPPKTWDQIACLTHGQSAGLSALRQAKNDGEPSSRVRSQC